MEPTSPTARAERLLAVVAVVSALPLLLVRYLPFTDLPEHVAAMGTMAQLLPGGGGAPAYRVSVGQSQYLLYHLAGGVLTRVVDDAVLANRLLLVAVALAWPFALRSLLRALDRDERLALLAPALFWSRALIVGFLPFVASIPLAVFSLATLIRFVRMPEGRARRGGVLALLTLVLFYTHVSSFVVFALAGGVITLAVAVPRRDPKLVAATALSLLPAFLAAVAWWRAGSLAARPGDDHHVVRLAGHVGANALPLWAFDIWRSNLDELWSGMWWAAIGLIGIAGLRGKLDRASLWAGVLAAIPVLCALAIYVATPFKVGAAGYLDVRLAPMVALLFLPVLRPSADRASRLAFILATVGALGTAATATYEMLRVQDEVAGDLDRLLGAMRPSTRVAMVNFEQRSPRMYFFPYVFAGAYHRLAPGGVAAYSFTGMDHWSVHYTPGAEPPTHPGLWTYAPCAFRYRSDGEFYDYVLVQGTFDDQRPSPFEKDHPGPDFHEVARTGRFLLLEKSSPEELAPLSDDRSICAPPDEG